MNFHRINEHFSGKKKIFQYVKNSIMLQNKILAFSTSKGKHILEIGVNSIGHCKSATLSETLVGEEWVIAYYNKRLSKAE